MKHIGLILTLSLFIITGCTEKQPPKTEEVVTEKQVGDPHSYAEPEEAVVTHLHWDAEINFDKQQISAVATWDINTSDSARAITFDLVSLDIHSVQDENGNELAFTIGASKPHLGAPLEVAIEPSTEQVVIAYTTAPSAEALQWLNPQQTAGKTHPFLFSQSQAILARTWIPVQDSPGIRYTYSADVKLPANLMAVMSASNPVQRNETGRYHYEMKQPVPAYLMALAAGDITYQKIGPRTGVYAEPSVIEAAAYEFAEMESMLAAAEALYGAYAWEVYDLIVLPPSFPFGGMENPRLTFATPTILAGDRSLTSLVAHELAHSWSGNLVTNATWDDFWLNEGFTVYFERRIMDALYGSDYAEMLASLGYQDLQEDLADLPDEDTHLKLDLAGRNPDDGMTDVAYEKGYFFLRMLEEAYGRDTFDLFLKNYFQSHAFQTITTEAFISYLDEHLIGSDSTARESLKIEAWIYGPGLPANMPQVSAARFQAVESTLKAWADGAFTLDELSTSEWSSHEWLHFIRILPDTLSVERFATLDKAFGFTQSGNSEVQAAWFIHTIREGYDEANPALESFLTTVGRRKFLVPIYKALIAADPTKKRAAAIYEKARPNYHAVSVETLDKLILDEAVAKE